MTKPAAAPSRLFRILGVGELLWDLLPDGPQLGGAPANFALHARALGADAALVSRVGADARGRDAVARLTAAGLPGELIQLDPLAPTGTVSVRFDAGGQPQFTIHEQVAWDLLTADAAAIAAVAGADAVCFGTLAQRTPTGRAAVQALVAASPATALRLFDINLRQHFHGPDVIRDSLGLANVLKISDAEWPVLEAQFRLTGRLTDQIESLARQFALRAVALTRGASGSLLYHRGEWADDPGEPVQVVDTIGAGDAFTSAMTMALLAGWRVAGVNAFAGEVGRYVCGHPGATPLLPSRFSARLQNIDHS
ncbi:MAG: carbohydrate kinase family protein [Limisphaerales bacterium]